MANDSSTSLDSRILVVPGGVGPPLFLIPPSPVVPIILGPTESFNSSINNSDVPGLNSSTRSTTVGFQEYGLCAPYPLCNPLGCKPGIAPAECHDCNKVGVGFALTGMCLLAVIIVFTNILVITIISRNASLRRRLGHIKVSLAIADIMVGLFVLPSGIYNLATTLYLPTPIPEIHVGSSNLIYLQKLAVGIGQKNSLASVLFGTITTMSLTASVYNLLLLSTDRFFAVAKPLQTQTGKYLSKKRLKYCLVAIWVFAFAISCLPIAVPSRFSYQMDTATLFFLMSVNFREDTDEEKEGAIAAFLVFYFMVVLLPYIATVALNIITMMITIRKLKFSKNNSSRKSTTSEQRKRLKMILEKNPEMRFDEKEKHTVKSVFKKLNCNQSSNNGSWIARDRTESVNSNVPFQAAAKEMNVKVTYMILTMVFIFTVCLCPIVIVTTLIATGSLECSEIAPAYNIAVYFLFSNSCANFFLYNLWHKQFRVKLISALKGHAQSPVKKPQTTSTIVNDKPRYTSGTPTFGRNTASDYHQKRLRGGFTSFHPHSASERESRL